MINVLVAQESPTASFNFSAGALELPAALFGRLEIKTKLRGIISESECK